MEDDRADRLEQLVRESYGRTPEPSASLRERILRGLDEHGPASPRGKLWVWWLRPAAIRLSPALLVAAAFVLVVAGVWMGSAGWLRERREPNRESSSTGIPPGASARVASVALARNAGPAGRASARVVAFMLVAPSVTHVALVGEFNDWDPLATPLVRVGRDGPWVTTVKLPPGRHVYGFVLDGSRWMTDPGAPLAPDEGFGAPNSVVVVGQDGSL